MKILIVPVHSNPHTPILRNYPPSFLTQHPQFVFHPPFTKSPLHSPSPLLSFPFLTQIRSSTFRYPLEMPRPSNPLFQCPFIIHFHKLINCLHPLYITSRFGINPPKSLLFPSFKSHWLWGRPNPCFQRLLLVSILSCYSTSLIFSSYNSTSYFRFKICQTRHSWIHSCNI